MTITTTASRAVSGRGSERLGMPAVGRVTLLPRTVDRESFSRVAETFARFLGTGRYLAIQSILVVIWIGLNIAVPILRWDPYPFILLNLAFSTQAAYAAPLILLAQNRQDDRDRAALMEDRAAATRVREDTEFLAREVAALRLAQSDAATRQYLRGELAHQLESLRLDLEALVRGAVRDSMPPAPPAPNGTAAPAGSARADGPAGPEQVAAHAVQAASPGGGRRRPSGHTTVGPSGGGGRPDAGRPAPAGTAPISVPASLCHRCGADGVAVAAGPPTGLSPDPGFFPRRPARSGNRVARSGGRPGRSGEARTEHDRAG
jgi:uncharacterized membrane protein